MINRSKILTILALLIVTTNIVGKGKSKAKKKPVTFLVYIAGDNNLHTYIQGDLDEMQRVGSNENVNILVYLNTRYPGQKKITKKLVVHKGYIKQHSREKRRDSGHYKTVTRAYKWAHKYFPSDHFVLVLWDHGSGSLNRSLDKINQSWLWWQPYLLRTGVKGDSGLLYDVSGGDRAVCYDDTTGNYLTDRDLQRALRKIVRKYRKGKKIDILAFDACLMADVEVAYAVQPYVDYLVSSQQTIFGAGYGYDEALTKASQGVVDPNTFAKNMVHAYEREYINETQDYTLSAVDLNKLDPLVKNINHVSALLTDQLKGQNSTEAKQAIELSSDPQYVTHFDANYYIDIAHFYNNLLDNLESMDINDSQIKNELRSALQEGLYVLEQCVIANATGDIFAKAGGLSIYFDQRRIDSTYPTLYWSKKTNWLAFLKAYRAA